MKSPGLSKTGIEYGDRGWNFYPGCLHKPQGICPVPHCWAEGMSKRKCQDFHNPHLIPELLLAPLNIKKPSVILVNFMGDLFGDWVNPDEAICWQDRPGTVWLGPDRLFALDEDALIAGTLKELVFYVIKRCPQHYFLFLTKAGWNLKKWAPFPDNAGVGISAWDRDSLIAACRYLAGIEAGLRYVSLEPLMGEAWVLPSTLTVSRVGWMNIGAATRPYRPPQAEWVENVVYSCLKAGVPVWLKNNLVKALPATVPFYVPPLEGPAEGIIEMVYRQEFPRGMR